MTNNHNISQKQLEFVEILNVDKQAVATIFPCFKYCYTSSITLIRETLNEEEIKVLVMSKRNSNPMISSSVKMPISEPSMV
ncbi:unnamed protein product [Schistosoma turkestanicum]|nr:unnamed protein product [Schistosoma turkestanicum]